MHSSFALLALATVALAKTDIGGCSKTTIANSITYYVPGTGEICEILDCGGGRAPPKTTVPGCAAYEGTSTYSPKYLTLAAATTTSAVASSTHVTQTSASSSAQVTSAVSSSASAPAVTSSAVVSTSSSIAVIESSSTLTSAASSASGVASSSSLSTVTSSSATAASNGTSSTSATPSPIQSVPNSAMGSFNAMGGLMVVAAGFAILL